MIKISKQFIFFIVLTVISMGFGYMDSYYGNIEIENIYRIEKEAVEDNFIACMELNRVLISGKYPTLDDKKFRDRLMLDLGW